MVSMMKLVEEGIIESTGEKPKIPVDINTFGLKTLDVYRIPLEYLFYNDENGRIAASIGKLDMVPSNDIENSDYNDKLEKLIEENNVSGIKKTMTSIKEKGQQVVGWVLDDGRIIDGNRRYTALRKIQSETNRTQFFEAVIIPASYSSNVEKRKIKDLELALQLGIERKEDYNSVDLAVDIYRTTKGENSQMTLEDYRNRANLKKKDAESYLNAAIYMNKFLDFIGTPNNYKIIKDSKNYALFAEMGKTLEKTFGNSDDSQVQKNETMSSYFGLVLYQMHVGIENNTGQNRLRDYGKFIVKTSRNDRFNEEVEDIVDDLADAIQESKVKNYYELNKVLNDENEKIIEFQKKFEGQLSSAKNGQNIEKFIKHIGGIAEELEDMKKRRGLSGDLRYNDISQEQLKKLMDLMRGIKLNSEELFKIYGKESK